MSLYLKVLTFLFNHRYTRVEMYGVVSILLMQLPIPTTGLLLVLLIIVNGWYEHQLSVKRRMYMAKTFRDIAEKFLKKQEGSSESKPDGADDTHL